MKFTIGGLVLIAVGVVCLMFGGIPYKTNETVLDLGPLKATATREKTLEVPPAVGAGLVGAGALMLIIGGRTRK